MCSNHESFEWFNDQLLKMKWLNDLVGLLVENVCHQDIHIVVCSDLHNFLDPELFPAGENKEDSGQVYWAAG
jgi:hypothetical protein